MEQFFHFSDESDADNNRHIEATSIRSKQDGDVLSQLQENQNSTLSYKFEPGIDAQRNTSSKRRTNLPKVAVEILRDWYETHMENPYPTEEERKNLEAKSGLNSTQVSTWLANKRRRDKRRPRISISKKPWEEMSPLDRWRNSPPEVEAAPLSAIAKAIERNSEESVAYNAHSYDDESYGITYRTAMSATSSNGNSSGASSGSSTTSAGSTCSFGRFHSRVSKPRRRRHRSLILSNSTRAQKKTETEERIYQCTFCTDKFKTKYDWSRHEKTLHLSLETWTCMLFGPININQETGQPECVFCGITNPNDMHFELHRSSECADKPPSARTFYRKDHLAQHLRRLHGIQKVTDIIQGWRTDIIHVNCRCGFCGQRFDNWTVRNNHLAEHFRAGAQIKDWKGCRGFDPSIAAMVENAIPPYLIGDEAKGMTPFSASSSAPAPCETNENSISLNEELNCTTRTIPTAFELLTVRLGQFVMTSQQTGVCITDEMLQREARRILYDGDEDPWNQTAADNREWLRIFKSGYGLSSDSYNVDGITSRQDVLHRSWVDGDSLPFITTTNSASCDSAFQSLFGIDDMVPRIPWALQTPECLAEYMAGCQMNQIKNDKG